MLALPCAQALALTTDQVIALRKAGISNELIEKMIQTEIDAQARGGIGKYVIQQKDGSEMIVYRASTPRGVVDYPLEGGTRLAWTGWAWPWVLRKGTIPPPKPRALPRRGQRRRLQKAGATPCTSPVSARSPMPKSSWPRSRPRALKPRSGRWIFRARAAGTGLCPGISPPRPRPGPRENC